MSTDNDFKNFGVDRLGGSSSGLVGAASLTSDVQPLDPVSGVLSEVRDHLSLTDIIGDPSAAGAAGIVGLEAAALIPAVLPVAAPAGTTATGIDYDQPVENGSGTGSIGVAASGDQRIDGILSGVRWNSTYITYSDPDSTADYQPGFPVPLPNFGQISAQQLLAVHATLNQAVYTQPFGGVGFSVEGFTNLTIDYAGAGSGAGTIRLANTSDPGTAYAYYPSSAVYGGDVFFGPSGRAPSTGNYDYYTIIHELGHSLGLKHGNETGGFGALPFDTDSMEFSVMTYKSFVGSDAQFVYNETNGFAQTFMMYDIAALQYMYGADFSSNAGNTVYTWSPTTGQAFVDGVLALNPAGNRIFETIWDGNGVDTYNLSNYSTNLTIDLNPGGHSTFSTAQLAYLGGGPNGGFARGNVFNALQYQGDARSLIENATGGSGADTITGNSANNLLMGMQNNDTLYGGDGSDTLDGGGGTDRVDGGGGSDIYYVNLTTDVASEVFNDAAGGIDSVFASNSFTLGFGLENLYLTALANTVTNSTGIGNTNANFISGNQYNNVLNGLGSQDTIVGGDGNDTIDGGGDIDNVNGGNGNDTYFVNLTTDIVSEAGGSGDDIVFAQNSFTIAAGIERLTLTAIVNTVTNSTGTGNAGNNIINGNQYNNVLNGLGGADSLFGNTGADELHGGDGADTLVGGVGADILIGGTAADIFRLTSVNDSLVGARDTIRAGDGATAFQGAGAAGGDQFDFSAIDARSSVAGNQAFILGGAGEGHITLANSGGNTVISGFVNPGATVDFQIVVEDGAVLAGAYVGVDFIL